MMIVVTEKHQKQLFHSSKTPFVWSLKLVTLLLFEKNARYDVILTSVTIIKQVFLCKLFC